MKAFRCWILPLVLASGLTTPVAAQNTAVVSQSGGSIIIDASRLNTIIPLDAPWRFHAGDDPRFADPGFDDSSWALIEPGAGKLLAAAHVPTDPAGRSWARLHIHILNAGGPLAVTIAAEEFMQYAAFANGVKIGETSGFARQAKRYSRPARMVLPQMTDVVLAVRFVYPGSRPFRYVPLQEIKAGQNEAVGDRTDLDRYRVFEDFTIATLSISLIFFAFVPVSLTLLLAQRRRSEYFWLAVFCFTVGMTFALTAATGTDWFPEETWSFQLLDFIFGLQAVACLEFVAVFADIRRGWTIRFIQGLNLAGSLLSSFSMTHGGRFEGFSNVVVLSGTVLFAVLLTYIAFAAYRGGRKESGVLLIPMAFLPASILIQQLESIFPNMFGSTWSLHLGGIGINLYDVGLLLFIVGLAAVMLYRFIRVSKDEELAAAELEAARTVQQLLIPATTPATPGFIVESVYLPAQQVGGDFFLILPAPEGSNDHSLLAVVGDVSGKGLQAAMVVSTIIGGLRMQLSRQPGEVLAHLNRMLTGNVSGFATCCAALIHPDGRMQIANAGNPAPYCNGEEVPTAAGLPLGLVSGIDYDETEYTVPAGSQLTFVSDGVVEATSFPAKELFGFDRTTAISMQPAAAIAEAASDFGAGAPQADDITVLTIVRT